jgi:arylformamidase
MTLYDITQEVFHCRVFPGDAPPRYERVMSMEDCAPYNLTNISMCVHNGTHVDAPRHFIRDGKAIHELDLATFYGKCTVADLGSDQEQRELTSLLADCQERLLLKNVANLTEDEAITISSSHVKLVGIEGQSVGDSSNPAPVHHILLGNGIIALEGLNLQEVEPGEYLLCAFPLALADSDGSPVRAVLIREES